MCFWPETTSLRNLMRDGINTWTTFTWNDRITAHFFRPEHEGLRIFLYVTPDVLGEIAGSDAAVDDFVTAVKSGPPGTTRQGLCQRALQTFEQWRNRGGAFPPYVGYLALFVLAAGIEGDFAPHAYYPRLRQLSRSSRQSANTRRFSECCRCGTTWNGGQTKIRKVNSVPSRPTSPGTGCTSGCP